MSPLRSSVASGQAKGIVSVLDGKSLWRRIAAFTGPGVLVAVGYMDPGNWATDIEAGSRLGSDLLFVVAMAGLAAILFQTLAARLGLVGLDLAQACRARYGPVMRHVLWLLAELAIIATDVAEVLGAALALNLLFHLPIVWGVVLTALDLLLVLALQGVGFRRLEAIVGGLIALIAASLAFNLFLSPPDLAAIGSGLIPAVSKLEQPYALYLAVGIVGATIMPHNLYLHSAIVQTRAMPTGGRRQAARFNALDTAIALGLATIVNGALLMLAASTFHANGHNAVASIEDAHALLAPVTGVALSGVVFALGLLAAGQSSTFTGTIAGQVILDGFLGVRLPGWQRRLITRGLAVVPALVGVLWLGEQGVGTLLILSQVVLAAQLPFALYPLIRITANRRVMGELTSPLPLTLVAWSLFIVLASADVWMMANMVMT
jgi:manganese transport protein